MREISLHLIDIIQNSISANATLIQVGMEANTEKDYIKITITDNGCGMDEETLKNVKDPFVTSRKTRRVGLGLSLFEAACKRCDGYLEVYSEIGKGTEVIGYMKYNHIDREPLGNIQDTIMSVLLYENVDVVYKHSFNENTFVFDSREIKGIVGEDLNNPEILDWIRGYIAENIENIDGGAI
ncbi:MAG: ATP-binding protein [Solirubrobacterales bacterium]